MKLFTAFLVLAVSASAQASQQAATPVAHITDQNDCYGVALVAEAAAIYYSSGRPKEDLIKRVSSPERMNKPAYKAMYPTIELIADDIYSGKSLDESFDNYVNPCLDNVGKPPLH